MKKLLAVLLGAVLIFSGVEAFAGPKVGGISRTTISGGRSYSGGAKPSGYTSSTKVASGNKSYTAPKPPTVTTAPKPPSPVTSNKSYSSGKKVYTPAPVVQSKPKSGTFDGNAAAAQRRAESKVNYVRGSEPRTNYTTPSGKQVPIDNNSRSVQNIRNISHTTYITRETRIHTFYGGYYGYPIVVYNDPYNSFFWYWLLDRSFEERALWAYHHRSAMDSARYQALLAKDARLEARIRQLEAEKRVVDPTYTPTGMEYDLQYTDDYVDSIYNPHTEHVTAGWFGRFMWWLFMILLTATVFFIVIYTIFVKRWRGL